MILQWKKCYDLTRMTNEFMQIVLRSLEQLNKVLRRGAAEVQSKIRRVDYSYLHSKYLTPLWLPSCLPLLGSSHSTPSQSPLVPWTGPT